MRQSEAAVALIRRLCDSQTRWLARWNSKWEAYHFVSGHRWESESFRECLVREIAEELGLREGDDYIVSTSPPRHLDFIAWSVSARAQTRYVIELYHVELLPDAHSRFSGDPANRWLDECEIWAGQAHDGEPISLTMARLLTESRLVPEIAPH